MLFKKCVWYLGCFIYPRVTIKTLSSPCKLFGVDVRNENWQHLFFTQNVKQVSFGIQIAKKCFPLFMKKVNFGVNMTKYQELVRSVNFFENNIDAWCVSKAACKFSVFCNKSCFWMFNWWFQKLGGSEPTPDGLALTFEFVRSRKGSFYDENIKKNINAECQTKEYKWMFK